MTILYIVGVLAIYVFIRRRPAQWIAMAIGIYALLRAPYAFVVPAWIEALTNDFRPLPDGFQKEQILVSGALVSGAAANLSLNRAPRRWRLCAVRSWAG